MVNSDLELRSVGDCTKSVTKMSVELHRDITEMEWLSASEAPKLGRM